MMSYKANIQASLMALAAPSVRNFSNKIWYFAHLFVPLQRDSGKSQCES